MDKSTAATMVVNIEEIRVPWEAIPDSRQVEKEFAYLEAVPESIAEDMPVVRRLDGGGNESCELVTGAVVLSALARLGRKEVRVQVVELSDDEIAVYVVSKGEHTYREPPLRKARAFLAWQAADPTRKKLKGRDIADKLLCSTGHVSELKSVGRLLTMVDNSPSIQSDVARRVACVALNQVPVKDLAYLARLGPKTVDDVMKSIQKPRGGRGGTLGDAVLEHLAVERQKKAEAGPKVRVTLPENDATAGAARYRVEQLTGPDEWDVKDYLRLLSALDSLMRIQGLSKWVGEIPPDQMLPHHLAIENALVAARGTSIFTIDPERYLCLLCQLVQASWFELLTFRPDKYVGALTPERKRVFAALQAFVRGDGKTFPVGRGDERLEATVSIPEELRKQIEEEPRAYQMAGKADARFGRVAPEAASRKRIEEQDAQASKKKRASRTKPIRAEKKPAIRTAKPKARRAKPVS